MAIKNQRKEIYEENVRLIKYVIDKHPELESELITEWLSNKEVNIDASYLEGIENLKEYKSVDSILKINFIAISVLFIFIFYIFEKDKRNTKKEIKKINEYINKIINNDFEVDFKDFKNTDLSSLKSDIGKIVMKLIENNENEIKQKQIMKDFLSNVSHQIKTPLTSLFVTNDILKNEIEDKKLKEFIKQEDRQLEKIEWLIQSLLKMSLLESNSIELQKENIEIKKLIEESLLTHENSIELKNINIIKKLDSTRIMVDKKWTVEAISNIINNAIEHTTDTIRVECGEIYFYKYIKISDNGNGIPKEKIKLVFERFYSNSKSGVGIGLNISKEIIEKQNGTIEISSDKGTTFEIRFY